MYDNEQSIKISDVKQEVRNINKSTNKSRTERRMEKTRKMIIAAAINLFNKNGVEETTMEQISEEADVARGTLYNYFSSREEIINEYIQQSFQIKNPTRFGELQEMPDTRTRMIYIFNQLIGGIQEQKELFEKYLIYRMQKMVSFQQNETEKSGFYLLGYRIIELGQKSGEIRDDIPLYILEDLFEFSFIEAIKPLYMVLENYNISEAIEHSVDLFMEGVKAKG